VFFWLIETCITNSYALYKEIQQKPMRHVTYRRSIVEALASRYMSSLPHVLELVVPGKGPIRILMTLNA